MHRPGRALPRSQAMESMEDPPGAAAAYRLILSHCRPSSIRSNALRGVPRAAEAEAIQAARRLAPISIRGRDELGIVVEPAAAPIHAALARCLRAGRSPLPHVPGQIFHALRAVTAGVSPDRAGAAAVALAELAPLPVPAQLIGGIGVAPRIDRSARRAARRPLPLLLRGQAPLRPAAVSGSLLPGHAVHGVISAIVAIPDAEQ